MVENFSAKQRYLLTRWVRRPEHSPLAPAPKLWEIGYAYRRAEEAAREQAEEEAEAAAAGRDWLSPAIETDPIEARRQFNESKAREDQRDREREEREEQYFSSMVEHIRDWFLESFEPPATGSSFDEYIWGGPYDARTVITTFFPDHTSDDDDDDDAANEVIRELERRSTSWVPTGSRIEPPPPRDAPRSAQDAFERLKQDVQALKELLSRIPEQPAGMGHNYPPEPLDDYPLTVDDQKELAGAVIVIENQPLEPADRGEEAKAAAVVIETKTQKIKSWLARQGDTFVTEAVKESGKQFGKWMPRAFWLLVIERMLGLTETLTSWLKLVFPAL